MAGAGLQQSSVCSGFNPGSGKHFLQQPAVQAVQSFGPFDTSLLIKAIEAVVERGLQLQASNLLTVLDEFQPQITYNSQTLEFSSKGSATSFELESSSEKGNANCQSSDPKVYSNSETKSPNAAPFIQNESSLADDDQTDGECLPSDFNHVQQPANAQAPQPSGAEAGKQTHDNQSLKLKCKALRQENMLLKERQACRQCRFRPVSVTLLPCGHYLYCYDCGQTFTACPTCRKTILADVKTYLA